MIFRIITNCGKGNKLPNSAILKQLKICIFAKNRIFEIPMNSGFRLVDSGPGPESGRVPGAPLISIV